MITDRMQDTRRSAAGNVYLSTGLYCRSYSTPPVPRGEPPKVRHKTATFKCDDGRIITLKFKSIAAIHVLSEL